ncbi:unnamed protein product [Protopolystoma xenopodis]|uniref:Uncharacterized protein n=1 Tax=Protopolystoma xenopodis TaxID=117903 RepID=A0A448WBB8_9PLAT|nr:unnamed protein product [Protopolystoma xenopodis]
MRQERVTLNIGSTDQSGQSLSTIVRRISKFVSSQDVEFCNRSYINTGLGDFQQSRMGGTKNKTRIVRPSDTARCIQISTKRYKLSKVRPTCGGCVQTCILDLDYSSGRYVEAGECYENLQMFLEDRPKCGLALMANQTCQFDSFVSSGDMVLCIADSEQAVRRQVGTTPHQEMDVDVGIEGVGKNEGQVVPVKDNSRSHNWAGRDSPAPWPNSHPGRKDQGPNAMTSRSLYMTRPPPGVGVKESVEESLVQPNPHHGHLVIRNFCGAGAISFDTMQTAT